MNSDEIKSRLLTGIKRTVIVSSVLAVIGFVAGFVTFYPDVLLALIGGGITALFLAVITASIYIGASTGWLLGDIAFDEINDSLGITGERLWGTTKSS